MIGEPTADTTMHPTSAATTDAAPSEGPLSVSAPVEVKTADTAGSAALAPRIEAMLLTSSRPVPPARLAGALGLMPVAELAGEAPATAGTDPAVPPAAVAPPPRRKRARAESSPASAPLERLAAAVAALNAEYAHTGRSFRIELVAGGYRIVTLAQFGDDIAALQGQAAQSRLSRPAVETLAIIAYRQPVTRAQLEAIRGVACGEVLRTLMDRRLVTIAGRAEEVGRPLLYATTRQFLDAFGLASLKDLPTAAEVALSPQEPAETPSPAQPRNG